MVEHNQSQYYGNQYKFNGKELDAATGMYYYGARYYDPRLSIFISVDPLAEDTMTPYQYCGNNPIMYIDPTGMNHHDYKKNKETGRLTLIEGSEDNPEYDQIIDDQGSILKVDKGVIKDENRGRKVPGAKDNNGNDITYDFYEFTDEKKAFQFYEFMYDKNTNNVEFSYMDMTLGSGENLYTIGTIGKYSSEGAWSMIFGNVYNYDKNVNLNEMRHNHPNGSLIPSDADIKMIQIFKKLYPNQNPRLFIDCNECKWNNETNKPDPKSSDSYHDKSFNF